MTHKRRHANTNPCRVIHMSAAISNGAIFNHSLTTLHFCTRVSQFRILADDLTLL